MFINDYFSKCTLKINFNISNDIYNRFKVRIFNFGSGRKDILKKIFFRGKLEKFGLFI